jgi:DNA-binding NarL/FixJ family response regulator
VKANDGKRSKSTAEWPSLTAREMAVLRAVATGDTNHEIGVRLGISGQTVKKHVSVLIQKLHVRNRVQLAVMVALRTLSANSRESK